MRTFDYSEIRPELLTKNIINSIASIHEYKGKQELFIEAQPDILNAMLSIAKVQSTGASNRIEGIHTTNERLEKIVNEKADPKNRNEQEIAGYREVLSTIHERYEYIKPSPNIILQLHRDLYSLTSDSIGGNYKNSDNVIEERDTEGNRFVRFKPVSAFETPEAVERLCVAYDEAIKKSGIDPLLLIPMFVLDFLCIHPFNDGNGRMSRLLTLLLLYRAGYIVGKYISIEMIIEKTKETYYDALQASSANWHEGTNSYKPFVEYYLGIINFAHKEFTSRVEHLKHRNFPKAERIKNIFETKLGRVTKKEIAVICPEISTKTIERTLSSLVKDGFIECVGKGRNAAYVLKKND